MDGSVMRRNKANRSESFNIIMVIRVVSRVTADNGVYLIILSIFKRRVAWRWETTMFLVERQLLGSIQRTT